MEHFLILLVLGAIGYMWYKVIYDPGKYKNTKWNRSPIIEDEDVDLD